MNKSEKFKIGTCKACGNKVSIFKSTCPSCGINNPVKDPNANKRQQYSLLSAICIIIAFAIAMFGNKFEQSDQIVFFGFVLFGLFFSFLKNILPRW